MIKSKIIESIPDDEPVIIAWWNRGMIEKLINYSLTDGQWLELVDKVENREWSDVHDDIVHKAGLIL